MLFFADLKEFLNIEEYLGQFVSNFGFILQYLGDHMRNRLTTD